MTDKEMVKEYFEELRKKKIPFNIPNVIKEIKQAYLAGLKAGRPKWHKVADGDLPKEEGEYLVCYETDDGNYRNIFILNYTEYDESLHWCYDAFKTYGEGVIAWCEIPKYTEE